MNLSMLAKPNSALVILGHGSTVNPDSSAPTFAHAAEIRRRGLFREVACAFWKEKPGLHEVLQMIASDDIYIVPNFISEGYFTQKVIPREMDLSGRITLRDGLTIKYCEPAGNHPRMTGLLLLRAEDAAPGIDRRQASLVIVGHGTRRHDNSATAVKDQVAKIAALKIYAEVVGAFMEQEPQVKNWRTLTTKQKVVFVPFFVSDGLHSYEDIPVLIGIEREPSGAASLRDIFRQNPHHLDGRQIYYSCAIGTAPEFADVILEQVEAFDQSINMQSP